MSKKEKTFTVKLGSYTTIAHEFEAPTPHIQKIMDEMTTDIHRAMYLGIDFGSGDMTSTAVEVSSSSTLTIADIYRAMDMLTKNNSKFPIPLEKRTKVELPKSEFKSWPYALED